MKQFIKNTIYRISSIINRKKDDTAILIFHSLNKDNVNGFDFEKFKSLIDFLIDKNVNFINFHNLDKKRTGQNVILTFDDGYKSVYTKAFDFLKKKEIQGTIFICPELVGKSNEIIEENNIPLEDEESLMEWAQIQEMKEHGWEIGSHTLSHNRLSNYVEIDDARENITRSIEIINKKLNQNTISFCYPFGRREDICHSSAKLFTKTPIKYAVVGNFKTIGNKNIDTDYLMPRVFMDKRDSNETIYKKITSQYNLLYLFSLLKDLLKAPKCFIKH